MGGKYFGDWPNWIPPRVIQVPYTTLLIRLIFGISTLMLGIIVWTCSTGVTDLRYPQSMLSLCQHRRWIENELSEESKFMSKTSYVKKKLHVLTLFKIVLGNSKFALAKYFRHGFKKAYPPALLIWVRMTYSMSIFESLIFIR